MRLGIISDTHNFLDPKIAGIFAGVEHILHAGDIGVPRLLSELKQVAPVTAVAGNTDEPGFQYPETQLVELAGVRFLVHHIVAPHQLSDAIKGRIARDKPGVVVFGHTHKLFHEWLDGTLFFNPGYAGKSRFGMERSVAILNCDAEGISWRYHPL
jgi:putative phosphoesterase